MRNQTPTTIAFHSLNLFLATSTSMINHLLMELSRYMVACIQIFGPINAVIYIMAAIIKSFG